MGAAVDPLSYLRGIGKAGVIVPSHEGPNGDTAEMLKTDTRQANWRRANPGKYEAHLAVQRAVKAGDLDKQTCEVCGVEAVDAHHDQYDKPLCVRWLCRRHHTRLHHYGEDMFPIKNSTSASGAGAD